MFVLIAMNDGESTRSSDYYSELCLQQEQQAVDDPDIANISHCKTEYFSVGKNQERPRFSLKFCCGDNLKLDRFLLVILVHHLVIFILVIFV